MSRRVLDVLRVFLVVIISTGSCRAEVSTKVTSDDGLENVVINHPIKNETVNSLLNNTLISLSHEKLENIGEQLNSNTTKNIVTEPLIVSGGVKVNETLIANENTTENKAEVSALEKPPPSGVSSSSGDDLVVTPATSTVLGDLLTPNELGVTTSGDLLGPDGEENFKDGATNETVPWWRRWPYPLRQRARPCECADYTCGCCAGMNIQRLNISQTGCLNFRYDPDEFSIEMEMLMNNRAVIRRSISGKNPPPLCIPLPSPVSFIPTIEFCARMFNVFTPGRNLHMCLDWQTKVNQAPVLELQFDCLRMGADGIAIVKPDAGGGLPDITGEGGGGDYGVIGGQGGGDEDYDPLDPDYPESGNKRPSKPLNTTSTTPAPV